MDEKELQETIESFLENPFWADYYDAAPRGAKEIIALEFYLSSGEQAHDDSEAQSALEKCREALEAEDVAYLACNSPNPCERAYYRKMQKGCKSGAESACSARRASRPTPEGGKVMKLRF